MGTKQLLLIVLGTIVVSLAIYSGIQISKAYYEQNQKDKMIMMLTQMITDAQNYFKTPAELGGGEGSFKNWEIPAGMTKIEGIGEVNTKKTIIKNKRVTIYLNGYERDSNNKIMRSFATFRIRKNDTVFIIKIYNSNERKWETIYKEVK